MLYRCIEWIAKRWVELLNYSGMSVIDPLYCNPVSAGAVRVLKILHWYGCKAEISKDSV